MRLLIALFLPWLTFFTIGRPISGLVCLVLQITLLGWIPATIMALSQLKADHEITAALQSSPRQRNKAWPSPFQTAHGAARSRGLFPYWPT